MYLVSGRYFLGNEHLISGRGRGVRDGYSP